MKSKRLMKKLATLFCLIELDAVGWWASKQTNKQTCQQPLDVLFALCVSVLDIRHIELYLELLLSTLLIIIITRLSSVHFQHIKRLSCRKVQEVLARW